MSREGPNGREAGRPNSEERTLQLAGEFSQCLHPFQTEAHPPGTTPLPRGHQPRTVTGQPDTEYSQQGSQYHWKLELFQQLNLPIYEGVRESLERLNQQRERRHSIPSRPQKRRKGESSGKTCGHKMHNNASCGLSNTGMTCTARKRTQWIRRIWLNPARGPTRGKLTSIPAIDVGPPLTRDQLTGTVPTIRETPRLSLLISPRLGTLTLSNKVPTMKYHPTAALMSQAKTVIYQKPTVIYSCRMMNLTLICLMMPSQVAAPVGL